MAEAAYKGNQARKAGLVQRLMAVGITIDQVRVGIQRRVTIKAPSSGSVVSVNVNIGMSVADNAGVMTLALDGAGIWVLTGYEGQTSMVKVGMDVGLSPAEGGANRSVPGKVVALSPIIEADRSWKIYCKPNNATSVNQNAEGMNVANVKIGQAVQGKLILNAVESLVLPDSAVFLRDGKNFCFVRILSSDPKKTAYVLTPIVVTGRQKNKVIIAQSPNGSIVVGGNPESQCSAFLVNGADAVATPRHAARRGDQHHDVVPGNTGHGERGCQLYGHQSRSHRGGGHDSGIDGR
ncbi:MAG: hypothetical protein EBU49_15635, partial [Proteobacteria bacterium]|nr:hypothetical protein [Pseudomonadota bacterium]